MNIETLIADANPVPPDRLPLARSERGLRVLADVWASATEARPGRRLGRDPGRPARPVTRRLMPSIALAGALAVGVAAVITTQAGPGSQPARPTPGVQAETAAYVLARAAAAQANTRNMISEQQDFINGVLGGSGTTWTDVATQQERVDSAERASSGLPYFQMTTAIKGGVYTNTTIENQHHAYTIDTASTSDHGPWGAYGISISNFIPLAEFGPDPAAAYRAALKKGIITVVGHRNLNGHDTILIRVKVSCTTPSTLYNTGCSELTPVGKQPPPSSLPASIRKDLRAIEKATKAGKKSVTLSSGQTIRLPLSAPPKVSPPPANEIWVDSSTYLVVQYRTYHPDLSAVGGSGGKWRIVTTSVTRLTATPAHLALLTVTPTARYTQVTDQQMTNYLGPLS